MNQALTAGAWAKCLTSLLGIVLALGGLYVGQSILGGLAFVALPSVLRERGVALDPIGLVHLISLPWALKIVWAAAVERYRLPPAGATRSRQIGAICGLFTVLGLVAVSAIGPAHWLPVLVVLVAIAASIRLIVEVRAALEGVRGELMERGCEGNLCTYRMSIP